MSSADNCWTDYRRLISQNSNQNSAPTKANHIKHSSVLLWLHKTTQSINISKLQRTRRKELWRHLRIATSGRLLVNPSWYCVGRRRYNNWFLWEQTQSWFDENNESITKLIEIKRQTRLTLENQPSTQNKPNYKQARANCLKEIRSAQNK